MLFEFIAIVSLSYFVLYKFIFICKKWTLFGMLDFFLSCRNKKKQFKFCLYLAYVWWLLASIKILSCLQNLYSLSSMGDAMNLIIRTIYSSSIYLKAFSHILAEKYVFKWRSSSEVISSILNICDFIGLFIKTSIILSHWGH